MTGKMSNKLQGGFTVLEAIVVVACILIMLVILYVVVTA